MEGAKGSGFPRSRSPTFHGQAWVFGPVAVLVSDELSYTGVHTLSLMTEQICPLKPFFQVEEAERWLAEESAALAARQAARAP